MQDAFLCEDCDIKFESSKALRLHIAQHKWGPHQVIDNGQLTAFMCLSPDCGKTFTDRKVLRKHLLTHRPRQYTCEFESCGKRFCERAKLKRHQLVHTGEKEFVCTDCDKHFAYKANLITHLRTHTGIKPFQCPFPGCSKSFAQASNRNSHVKTHSLQPPSSKRRRSSVHTLAPKVPKLGNALSCIVSHHNSPSLSSAILFGKIPNMSPINRETSIIGSLLDSSSYSMLMMQQNQAHSSANPLPSSILSTLNGSTMLRWPSIATLFPRSLPLEVPKKESSLLL